MNETKVRRKQVLGLRDGHVFESAGTVTPIYARSQIKDLSSKIQDEKSTVQDLIYKSTDSTSILQATYDRPILELRINSVNREITANPSPEEAHQMQSLARSLRTTIFQKRRARMTQGKVIECRVTQPPFPQENESERYLWVDVLGVLPSMVILAVCLGWPPLRKKELFSSLLSSQKRAKRECPIFHTSIQWPFTSSSQTVVREKTSFVSTLRHTWKHLTYNHWVQLGTAIPRV